MPTSSQEYYLDRLHASEASLKALFEAARLDEAEGRRVLDKLEEIVTVHEALGCIEPRSSGYSMGLRERLKGSIGEDGGMNGLFSSVAVAPRHSRDA